MSENKCTCGTCSVCRANRKAEANADKPKKVNKPINRTPIKKKIVEKKPIDLEAIKGKNVTLKSSKRVKTQEELDEINKKKLAEKQRKAKDKAKAKREEKKFNKSTLMNVADTVFSLYIRLKGTDELGFGKCCSSGRITPWKSIDCGHNIPRGYMKYRYDERNCHVQSKHDNGRLHGNIPEYRRFIIDTYGEEVEREMFEGSKEYFKPESDFYLNIIKEYLPKVKELLKTKSFEVSNYWDNMNRFEKIYLK